jgi:hypothetical protein
METNETPKKMTVLEVLEKVGFNRIFDYLFDELGTAGILEKMTSDLTAKREKLLEAGEKEQAAKAARMHQILFDATRRAKLI